MKDLAQNNKKLKNKLEKEDAIKKLGKNKNVQIIGGKSKLNSKNTNKVNSKRIEK